MNWNWHRGQTAAEAYEAYRDWAFDSGIEPKDFSDWLRDFFKEEAE